MPSFQEHPFADAHQKTISHHMQQIRIHGISLLSYEKLDYLKSL
ncbi:TPA: hypothetical protein MCY48_004134 [Klebsiella pneumoniae]|uniref:Uncharacterized protein n=2 Tax=Klebsiella pneumoniae subsp. pneumoniae TaxID=72407 RepID=A0A0H3GK18_KLEPH|nr:hypothetical protein [Klebsiella pneumoniae]YP_005225301.1 hypothetical protein KPHS_10000 [Klebsiella pneumoniae subsp. pneumoniae HS11286]AIW69587.1 hypothetical protein KPNIH33_05285 [Klebsiella pneumoniae subsp. pneumoniae]AKR85365.1 hypothetical protein H218_21635 [Klebsiella pneumoniae DMC1097]AKR90914.1 hypothetical protein J052_21310 [Klebsiella pneumoniae 500_1420]AKR96393.1 hypothetical protein H224_21370 [Klebsiella pneumoniae UHKPC07]AKS01860.1 hypothetical protein H222_21435 [